MGFTEIENTGKRIFEKYPKVKRIFKRGYQLVSYALAPNKKTKFEGDLKCISPNDEYEYFYGYYDKSPWDCDDRYVIALKANKTYKEVAPRETAEIVLIDTLNNNQIKTIGKTNSWNVQQACMAQWIGPDFKSRIIFNDFRNGSYCSVVFNVIEMKEEKVLSKPIYDVSKDGKIALSLDFSRLHRMRPGYGYSNIPDVNASKSCPDETCVWKIDVETGKTVDLLKYTDMANFEPDETMKNAEHKVNHLMISPNGKKFMVLHRWFQDGHKHTRLVTANIDGTDKYNLSDDVFVSHCYWKNDEQILAFLRKNESGNHYYLMNDKTQNYTLHWSRLNTDGHCSYSPDKSLVITDSYPNRKRQAFVYVCTENQEQPARIAKVFSPFKYDNDCRCDLHPRWNNKGDKVCIDSVHNGKRGLYVIPIKSKDIPPVPAEPPKLVNGKYKIVYVITNCKNTGPMNQTLNIIKNLDRSIFQPIVITLFQEDLGDSVVQRYLDVVPEFYCLKMSKISSIIKGKKILNELLEEIKPDLIQGLGMPAYTMSLAYKNAKHLVTLRNYCYEDYPDKYGKVLGNVLAVKDMNLIKKQISKKEVFVTCSQSLSVMYKEKRNLEFGFIRNGVDINKYTYADKIQKIKMKEKLNVPQDKIIVAYSGQFIDRKDQEFAIQGMLNSSPKDNIYMIFMGAGANFNAVTEKYKNVPNIRFTGNINNVDEYLQACDIYVSASKSEGMPNGVLEAMSTGLPVLLSDIPQHLEVLEINDTYGQSYKLGDMNDFINQFEIILEKDLIVMGENSNKVAVNEFSAGKMSQKYQDLYLEILKKV